MLRQPPVVARLAYPSVVKCVLFLVQLLLLNR